MLRDLTEYAVMNLRRRSLRSWLTILGIVIGVLAIVTMVSIAEGLDLYIRSQLSIFGNDVISVQPGSLKASLTGGLYGPQGMLTENDLEAIKRLSGVGIIGATIEGRTNVQYRDQTISLYSIGADANLFSDIYSYDIGSGRWMRENERGVAVIGYDIADSVFDEKIPIGRRIIIENKSFTVIGIGKKSGGGLMAVADTVVYIPREDARDIVPGFQGNKQLTEIHLKVTEGTNPQDVEALITKELLRLHKVREEKKDFTTITAAYVGEQVGNITAALGLFLGGIAAISLLVGSIGIANTMFMGILERTKEIGIMKAVGATNKMIMQIFLIESGIIGLVGGVLGLVFSYLISRLISELGVPSQIKPEVMIGALAFSFIVGVVAGYVPAKNAAKLDAVESLRFE